MVDSGGANLPNQDEVFPDRDHFGRIFYNQARMSAKGHSTSRDCDGVLYSRRCLCPCDVRCHHHCERAGNNFLSESPLVKAATGEVVSAEALGGGDVHTRLSGVADYLAEDDAHAIALARQAVSNLNRPSLNMDNWATPEDPAYDPAELLGVVPNDLRQPYDIREVIARLVDGSRFDEFKARFGETLVTGFAHVMGCPIGIIANNGVLFSEAAQKGAHFVELCSQRKIHWSFCKISRALWLGKNMKTKVSHATAQKW